MSKIYRRAVSIVCWVALLITLTFFLVLSSQSSTLRRLEGTHVMLALITCVIASVVMDWIFRHVRK